MTPHTKRPAKMKPSAQPSPSPSTSSCSQLAASLPRVSMSDLINAARLLGDDWTSSAPPRGRAAPLESRADMWRGRRRREMKLRVSFCTVCPVSVAECLSLTLSSSLDFLWKFELRSCKWSCRLRLCGHELPALSFCSLHTMQECKCSHFSPVEVKDTFFRVCRSLVENRYFNGDRSVGHSCNRQSPVLHFVLH